jgi:hypothetical protein
MKSKPGCFLSAALLAAAALTAVLLPLSPPAAAAATLPGLPAGLVSLPPGPHPSPTGTGPFSYTATMISNLVVMGPGTTNSVAVGTVSVTNLNPVTGVLVVVVGISLMDGNCTPGREVTWALLGSADASTYTPVHAPPRGTVTVTFPTPLVFNVANPSTSNLSCLLAMAVTDTAGASIELMVQAVGKFQ